MAERLDTMMDPPVEERLGRCHSKFSLVTLASKRARQINSYYGHLGDGTGQIVPPQVTSTARKPLSIAYEEIRADKILPVNPEDMPQEPEIDEDAAAAAAGDDAEA